MKNPNIMSDQPKPNIDNVLVPRATLEKFLQLATEISGILAASSVPVPDEFKPPVLLDIPYYKIVESVYARAGRERRKYLNKLGVAIGPNPDQTSYPIPGKVASANTRAYMVRCLDQGFKGKASVEDLVNATLMVVLYWTPDREEEGYWDIRTREVRAGVHSSLVNAMKTRQRGVNEEPQRMPRTNYAIFKADEDGSIVFTAYGKKMAKHYQDHPASVRTHLSAYTPLDKLHGGDGCRVRSKSVFSQPELAGKKSDY